MLNLDSTVERPHKISACLLAMLVLGHTAAGWAHAFPEHAEPGAGARLTAAPHEVLIRFDRMLESNFSSLHVEDHQGHRVDVGKTKLSKDDLHLLQVCLPPLKPGTYRVIWSAFSLDGHRTQGDYSFVIR